MSTSPQILHIHILPPTISHTHPFSTYPTTTPQNSHMHAHLKLLHVLHTCVPLTKYLLPLAQGISQINGYLAPPTAHPIQNTTHSTLQIHHTHFLPSLHIYAHTMHAYISSPTSISFHTHIYITGAQICQSHTQSSYIPGISISPPCSKTRQPPWIKEHEGSWQHEAGKLG